MTERSEIFKHRMMTLLKELSNKSYQIRSWVEGNNVDGSHSISFTEAAIELFDDALVKYALEEGAIIYDKKVTQAFWELHASIDGVDEFRSEEDIINDPLMQVVRDKAAEILYLIEVSDKFENTVNFIEEGTLGILEP